jgi:hypothetical protein
MEYSQFNNIQRKEPTNGSNTYLTRAIKTNTNRMKLLGYSIILACLRHRVTSAADQSLEFGHESGDSSMSMSMSMTYHPSSAPFVNILSPTVPLVTLAPLNTTPTIATTKAPMAVPKTLDPTVSTSPIQPTIFPTTAPTNVMMLSMMPLSVKPTTLAPTILAVVQPTIKAPTSLAPAGARPTHSPIADGCIPHNISGIPFADIRLLFAVESMSPPVDFLDALSQGLLAAVMEELPSLCLAIERRLLLPSDDLDKVMNVKVTDVSLLDGSTCVPSIDGAMCHVVESTLRVHGKTVEDAKVGSIAVVALLRSKLEQGDLLLLGEDILAIREYEVDQLLVDQPIKDTHNGAESSRGMNSGAMMATIVVVSGLVCLSIALVLLHKRLSQKQENEDEKLDVALSQDKCNESYITTDIVTAFSTDA